MMFGIYVVMMASSKYDMQLVARAAARQHVKSTLCPFCFGLCHGHSTPVAVAHLDDPDARCWTR